MESWIVYLLNFLIAATVFMGWAWLMRIKYSRAVSPSKGAPQGKLLAEFWPETGMRYRKLLPIEIKGIEIRAPKGHQCPRYFFDKASTNMTKYPDMPFLNLKFLQVDLPIVSWCENNPEPINPYKEKPLVTALMIDSTKDEDFAAFTQIASKEIAEAEKALQDALKNAIPKTHMYLLLLAAVIGSSIAAFIGWQIVGALKAHWGM